MKRYLSSISTKTFLLFSTLVLLLSGGLPAFASAAQLTQAGVRLGRLGISAGSADNNDLLVTFKLNTAPTTVAKIDIVLTGFTVTTGTPAVGTGTYPLTPAGITAPPGTLTAAATAGTSDITISGLTSASLVNTTLYGFTIPTGTITNPATAGQYSIKICSETSGGTAACATNTVDTTLVSTYIYGASANADQVTVNASVSGNFSFALSANSDTIPKIDITAPQTSTGITMTVSTNSPLGYTAYVKSKNGALTSAGTPGTPITSGAFNAVPDVLAGGTSDYTFVPTTSVAGATNSGAIAYDAEYTFVDGTHGGAFNGTSFASFQSRNGYSSGDQILLKERATVSNTVAAANDYTDTLTIVAAGNF